MRTITRRITSNSICVCCAHPIYDCCRLPAAAHSFNDELTCVTSGKLQVRLHILSEGVDLVCISNVLPPAVKRENVCSMEGHHHERRYDMMVLRQ